ncbi:MAG: hypothetical protein ACE5E1_05615 [Phycisphaerae bacterium]
MFDQIFKLQPEGDRRRGLTFYVGGAGPIGNVGSFDVPGGMRDAGYQGLVKPFTWQSWNHAGDQMNLRRNREKGAELADEIKRYRRRHPNADINIIALSAGTGVATFALEYLKEGIDVHRVVFFGCSLSRRYDLTRALKRIRDRLYVLYSPHDMILKDLVWYTGTVDRSEGSNGIAGLEGFRMPSDPRPDTREQYRKLRNVPYRSEFSAAGYDGGHTDATNRAFIRRYIAPALMGDDRLLLGSDRGTPGQPASAPTSRPTTEPAPSRLRPRPHFP